VATDKNESGAAVRFATSGLPWCLAAGMFALYLATLEHWVTFDSLRTVTSLSGLNWRPELQGPVISVVTYPLHWLPASAVALALNGFTALCAALALGLLARSVALIPHQQTEGQRQRLPPSAAGLLAIPNGWLPPTLAVLVCGLQLSFWQHAIAVTGEMFDLLLFAYAARCLLEYRLAPRNTWLLRFAFVYGLAIAEDWAMVAFAPAFLLALARLKGLAWFNREFFEFTLECCGSTKVSVWRRILMFIDSYVSVRLLTRFAGCGLLGVSLVLLLPLLASWSPNSHVNFWPALHYILGFYKGQLTNFPRAAVLIICATSLVPVLFIGMRWGGVAVVLFPSLNLLAAATLHLAHGIFLALCLWLTLDPFFSPRGLGFEFPCLPLYYLAGLGAGYYSGYFLLLFGTNPLEVPSRPTALARIANRGLVWLIGLLPVAIPALLLYKNLPEIRMAKKPAVEYSAQLERCLPPPGAVILSDEPFRLVFLQSLLVRHQQLSNYLLIDSALLEQEQSYFHFLQTQHPRFKSALTSTNLLTRSNGTPVLTPLVQQLAGSHEIYYLHPPFGSIAEVFYAQPHGLFYQLKPLTSLHPPPLPGILLSENRAFWQALESEQFPELLRRLQPSPQPTSWGLARLLNVLRFPHLPGGLQTSDSEPLARTLLRGNIQGEKERGAVILGADYSLALNCWGVELQKAGMFPEATHHFELARQFNPDNVAARLNLQFNQDNLAHKPVIILSPTEARDRLGQFRSWAQVLLVNGPLDEPNSCAQLGSLFAEAGCYRQSVQQFERAKVLAPNFTSAVAGLARSLLTLGENAASLAEAQHALFMEPQNTEALFVKGIALSKLDAHSEVILPMTRVLDVQTTNVTARLYRAVAYMKTDNLDAAQKDYEVAALANPSAYQAYFGLAEIAYRKNDSQTAIRNCQLYLETAPPDFPDTQRIRVLLLELTQKH
jgi:tetratricopeptide (TPR) repeat protein